MLLPPGGRAAGLLEMSEVGLILPEGNLMGGMEAGTVGGSCKIVVVGAPRRKGAKALPPVVPGLRLHPSVSVASADTKVAPCGASPFCRVPLSQSLGFRPMYRTPASERYPSL